jgi:SAM-dependent methyltransferase
MQQLRKEHNAIKRKMIQENVRPGQTVLDCGCGRGGDLLKWQSVQAKVTCVDPDRESLDEAKSRAKEIGFDAKFVLGDIHKVKGTYDVVCYNFSLHYEKNFSTIVSRVKPGGLLMGIVPDPERLETEWFMDRLGNTCIRDGDVLKVKLCDGPFYNGVERSEPILDTCGLKNILKNSFETIVWEPMTSEPTGLISDIYTKFVFKKNV